MPMPRTVRDMEMEMGQSESHGGISGSDESHRSARGWLRRGKISMSWMCRDPVVSDVNDCPSEIGGF
jgi:hypothetical protein